MRLIDADVVVKDIADLMLSPWFCAKEGFPWRKEAVEIVRDLCVIKTPTVDAEPVRHGEWLEREDDYDWYVFCSECGDEYVEDKDLRVASWVKQYFNYCPYCGAKMDKRKKNERVHLQRSANR